MNLQFRAWLQNTWMEHKDEKMHWNEPVNYTINEWIRNNLQFLTTRYKSEIKNK